MNHFKVSTLMSNCGWGKKTFKILIWWLYEGCPGRETDRRQGGQLKVWAELWV